MANLASTYRDLLERSGRHNDELTTRCRLLDALGGVQSHLPLHEWITAVDNTLDLDALLVADGTVPEEVEALG